MPGDVDVQWAQRRDAVSDANLKQVRLRTPFLRRAMNNPHGFIPGPAYLKVGIATGDEVGHDAGKKYLALQPTDSEKDGVRVLYPVAGSTAYLSVGRLLKRQGHSLRPGRHELEVLIRDGIWFLDCLA